jgi:hypothetical protein
LDIVGGKHDWEKKLAKFEIDSILLPVTSSMSTTLKESGRWVPVYDDGIAILFHSRERVARGGVRSIPTRVIGAPRAGEASRRAHDNNNNKP